MINPLNTPANHPYSIYMDVAWMVKYGQQCPRTPAEAG
jgi:hypothetical protein